MTTRQFIVTLENSAPHPHIEQTQVVEVGTAAELYSELVERFQLPTSGIRIIFHTSPAGVPRSPVGVNDVMVGVESILWIRIGIP